MYETRWAALQTLCDFFYYDYTKETYLHCTERTDQSECAFKGCPGQLFMGLPVEDKGD